MYENEWVRDKYRTNLGIPLPVTQTYGLRSGIIKIKISVYNLEKQTSIHTFPIYSCFMPRTN